MTLADILRRCAELHSDRIAFVFEDDDKSRTSWTYGELDRRARAIAAHISQHAVPGDRAMLVFPAGLEFIAAFMGCIYAGVIPVPATQPKPRRPSPRLDAIVTDCRPRLALTNSLVLASLDFSQLSSLLCEITWECTDRVASPPAVPFVPIDREADDLAFLQYTSGSTADPRGVMISHRNALHNLGVICEAFGIEREARDANTRPIGVFWLPAYHDMGLVGSILMPMYVSGTTYLIAPTTFLRQPGRWLELVSETKATISGAPNFGYELAVRRTTAEQRESLDLRHWRTAFCGAEPVNADTLDEFAEAFAAAGFERSSYLPCYGLAEAVLFATGGRRPEGPLLLNADREQLGRHRVVACDNSDGNSQRLVGCGPSHQGLAVEIVDPHTHQLCAEDQVGEIWLSGESVARGYWNHGESQPMFHGNLSRPERNGAPRENYLRTGDLGFRWEDELFVTGRIKDVIIIRGRNHYPQDIERTALQAHAATDLGAAFATVGDREERLVVVLQLRREFRKADAEEVFRAVRHAIVSEHEVDPYAILLIQPASLPITSSGKVQRSRCRELFELGELAVRTEWTNEATDCLELAEDADLDPAFLSHVGELSPDEIRDQLQPWLIRWISHRAGLQPGSLEPSTAFAELGIDSLTALEISQELDEVLQTRLPPMVIWSCPTPADLASYLAEQIKSQEVSISGDRSAL